MADPTTTRLLIPYPLGGDAVSLGPAEMQAMANVIDVAWGLDFTDFMAVYGTTGKVQSINATGPTVNTSTGVITFTLTPDVAWPVSSSVLTRTLIPGTPQAMTPGTLPTSGNSRCVRLYVSSSGVWGANAVFATGVGTSQSTAAAALANPPSVAAGNVLLQDVVLTNTAGVYSISLVTDRRIPIGAKRRWGYIGSDASIGASGSNNYTVAHSGTGLYTITFSGAYWQLPSAVATPSGTTTIATIFNLATTLVEFEFFNLSGTPTDTAFAFSVTGQAVLGV